METARFRKREKKKEKKMQKMQKTNGKIYEYIFFLKQYISVWLVIEHFSFFR